MKRKSSTSKMETVSDERKYKQDRPNTQQEALQVLVHAIEIAQSRGAYNLFEAAEIVEALKLFKTKPDASSSSVSGQ